MPLAARLIRTSRRLRTALACAVLAGAAALPAAATPPLPNLIPATWDMNMSEYRGQNGARLVFECPPNPRRTGVGFAWGTGVYSDDSALCVAAVHAGVLTFERGGQVQVTVMPGRDGYEASTRNGVESGGWGAWSGSFSVAAPSAGTSSQGSPSQGAYRVGQTVQILWNGSWYPGHILAIADGGYQIHYEGYDASWDEWVTPDRLAPAATR